MILLDYYGIAVTSFMSEKQACGMDENALRHVILNNIRHYNSKFRKKYGQMVIACDSSSWRRDKFPLYKHVRRTTRKEQTDLDWTEIFRMINAIRDEIADNFPYKVVMVPKCEADDVIGALVEYTQEFGKHEEVMIVSSDKDFLQLQRYPNVRQFSPRLKEEIVETNPIGFLFEHILRGDASDGIPNVLSPDDIFTQSGVKQKSVTKKFVMECKDNMDSLKTYMKEDTYRNYLRNKAIIDLTETPPELKERIVKEYETPAKGKNGMVLKYLIKNRLRNLIEKVQEFHS